MSFCAPGRTETGFTCFTLPELKSLATAVNKIVQDKSKIRIPEQGDEENVKKYLHEQLTERFKTYCGNNETCWLDSNALQKSLKKTAPHLYETITKFSLKPKATKGKSDWLSTMEIEYVMQQYEKMYGNFKFLGCIPSDYYKLNPKDFPAYDLDHYRYSAIVFNHDEAHKRGSHWVAIFFENKPDGSLQVEYFDATGDKPVKNIAEFFKHPYFQNADYLENSYGHQRGNNECGVYSLYYIIKRLQGVSPFTLRSKRISDTQMNKFREEIFRPYSEEF